MCVRRPLAGLESALVLLRDESGYVRILGSAGAGEPRVQEDGPKVGS